jgi:hypothetical protein
MKNYQIIKNLINEIIDYNIYLDNLVKKDTDTGDNWTVHHLKSLKALIEENKNES